MLIIIEVFIIKDVLIIREVLIIKDVLIIREVLIIFSFDTALFAIGPKPDRSGDRYTA